MKKRSPLFFFLLRSVRLRRLHVKYRRPRTAEDASEFRNVSCLCCLHGSRPLKASLHAHVFNGLRRATGVISEKAALGARWKIHGTRALVGKPFGNWTASRNKRSYITGVISRQHVSHLVQRGCQTDSTKGMCGCRSLFPPIKHTQFDQSAV